MEGHDLRQGVERELPEPHGTAPKDQISGARRHHGAAEAYHRGRLQLIAVPLAAGHRSHGRKLSSSSRFNVAG